MTFRENLLEYLPVDIVDSLLDSQEEERTSSLILNTRKIKAEDFKKEYPNISAHDFIENTYYFDKNEYQFGKSYMFENGAYYLIDTSSLLVSYYLPTNEHDLVLDMCSAPGGKTISLLLQNQNKNLHVIANDISYNRCLELSKNIERQGFGNVVVTNNDLTQIYKHYLNKFNAIILDAPCSGSAMFRKNEQAKKEWSINKVLKMQETQLSLLNIGLMMLKPGGYLMYSTCSFSKEENEDVILQTIEKFDDIEIVNIEAKKEYFKSDLLPEAIHIFPNMYKGEGQFLCLLHKKGTPNFPEKSTKNTIFHKNLWEKYKISQKNEKNLKNEIYFYDEFVDFSKFKVIRYGLHFGKEEKNVFIPDFHLAHYLSNENSIVLDESNFKKYIHGEELQLNLNLKNDFYVVSYKGLNLGFVKYVNGKLKNYYPKGLRH